MKNYIRLLEKFMIRVMKIIACDSMKTVTCSTS